MRAVDFPESNLTLVGPKKLAEINGEELKSDPFDGIEIYDLKVFTDGTTVVSCWQFEESDWEELKRNGGKIYFCSVTGRTQAPMSLHVQRPFPPIEEQVVVVDDLEALAAERGYPIQEVKDYFAKLTGPGEAWRNYWRLKAGV
jgi:hypothetical protein